MTGGLVRIWRRSTIRALQEGRPLYVDRWGRLSAKPDPRFTYPSPARPNPAERLPAPSRRNDMTDAPTCACGHRIWTHLADGGCIGCTGPTCDASPFIWPLPTQPNPAPNTEDR